MELRDFEKINILDITHRKPEIVQKIEQEAMRPCEKSPIKRPAGCVAVSKTEYRLLKQAEKDGFRPTVIWRGELFYVNYTPSIWD